MKKIGDNYPNGPCEFPMKCLCGKILTEENVVDKECEGECEVCQYCGISKCPECGEHTHCGGCV